MDFQRRVGKVKTAFGYGIVFVLFLYWLDGPTRKDCSQPTCDNHQTKLDVSNSSIQRKRIELYGKMEADLDTHGAAFLDGAETSQSLKLSDLFTIEDDKVIPVHKWCLGGCAFTALLKSAANSLAGVWYQDPQLYHFSLFHASHHLEPTSATPAEVQAELAAVEQIAKRCCPLEIALDRVVLTSTGVLLGCWQVLNGTDPATIREELRTALPQAPKKQLYAPEILHTSFARILGPPVLPTEIVNSKKEALKLFQKLVLQLNKELCDFQALVTELWFVEELDILALALKGRMRVSSFSLQCSPANDESFINMNGKRETGA